MEQNSRRLIDEAISFEPLKNTFRLGWEFITLNKQFSMTAIVVLIVLSLLGTIPLVGFIFSLFSSLFALAIQIYVGRLVYESQDIEHFVDEVRHVDGQHVIERYFSPALGVYLGWMLLALLFIIGINLAIGGSSVAINLMNNEELLALFLSIAPALLLVTLVFSYLQPLIQANVVMANDFKEGFFAVLTLFSTDVWRNAMRGVYFKYISIYGLITLFAIFGFSFLFSVVASIPILNIVVLTVFIYIFSVMMTVSSVIAKRLVE